MNAFDSACQQVQELVAALQAGAARMVSLVEQMLDAKQRQAAAQTDRDRTFYERKCDHLDKQIDALVYELYGLTAEEIAIVEGASG